MAFALLDRHIPALARLLWSEAFNLRVGRAVGGYSMEDGVRCAYKRGGRHSGPCPELNDSAIHSINHQSNRRFSTKDQRPKPKQNTQGLPTADVWMAAERDLGIPAQQVPTLTERDAWEYHTWKGTVDGGRQRAVGRSMVCCVFVCG